MLSILVAILGLALLIVVHEAGHFLVARLCGMRVERFSIGFGKPLVSFKRGDTIYQIAPIPLGGFVQITGLNPHEEFDQKDPYVYPNRPRWMRLSVLVAGPAANYLTAVLIAIGIFAVKGIGMPNGQIHKVVADSPAAVAGLKEGDVILEANGRPIGVEQHTISEVVTTSGGAPVTFKYRRGTEEKTVVIAPRMDQGDYRIGVMPGATLVQVSTARAIGAAVVLPVELSGQMLQGMWEMIVGKQKANLSGPVGIAQEIAKAAEQGLFEYVRLLMYLSVYLGLFNLLPVPALDGGRVLFLGINSLPIRQVSAKREAAVHMVGLLLLLGLIVVVTFKDIKNIFVK